MPGKLIAKAGQTMRVTCGDLWSIEVNDYEHSQIPEAVISGG